MTKEQIEAVRKWAGNPFADNPKMRAQVIATLDHLTTRLSEVERERDEAAEALKEAIRILAKSSYTADLTQALTRAKELEAEVARLARDREAYSRQTCNLIAEVQDARADLATLRAAIAEAVSELENLDETFDYAAFCRALDTLRNLDQSDTPSERIMSDKDRENPVEGAHPTQPEPEDALVAVAREMTLLDGIVRTDNQKAAIRAGLAGQTASEDFYDRLRTALASRGLVVRGEGVGR